MYTFDNIVKFFIAFLFSSILLGKSNENEVLKSDLDSLNILTKKSPERAIRFARELLKKVTPISESNFEYKINNTLGEIFLDLQMYGQAMSHFTEANMIREKIGQVLLLLGPY
ncbi:MAG: hypothetical protein CM15mP44_6170 [Candidatus Neomarinimicrobiota bacterium]|nr:MAG: hypothetical protein CM15mP44_6170 [Candidatus Neomarinimicrobiota bacterium]